MDVSAKNMLKFYNNIHSFEIGKEQISDQIYNYFNSKFTIVDSDGDFMLSVTYVCLPSVFEELMGWVESIGYQIYGTDPENFSFTISVNSGQETDVKS